MEQIPSQKNRDRPAQNFNISQQHSTWKEKNICTTKLDFDNISQRSNQTNYSMQSKKEYMENRATDKKRNLTLGNEKPTFESSNAQAFKLVHR
jgi:hypothetical protein